MNALWRARMVWVPEAEGGRKIPFGGLRYLAQGYFEEFDPDRTGRAFCSTAFYFDGPAATGVKDMCWVTTFLDDQPADLFFPGRVIGVFEGTKLVARCEILGGGNDCIGVTAD